MYWNEQIETMPRERLRTLQLERLQVTLRDVHARNPIYRERFDKAGVGPDDLHTLGDLHRFPFTYKSDLRDNYPFGLFSRPLTEVVRIHGSSARVASPRWSATPVTT